MAEANQESYHLAEGVLSVDVEDENFLLSINSGKYFGVKGAMRHLLEGLRDGLSFAEMVALVCARYDVGREDAADDLRQVLGRLVAAGIVEQVA